MRSTSSCRKRSWREHSRSRYPNCLNSVCFCTWRHTSKSNRKRQTGSDRNSAKMMWKQIRKSRSKKKRAKVAKKREKARKCAKKRENAPFFWKVFLRKNCEKARKCAKMRENAEAASWAVVQVEKHTDFEQFEHRLEIGFLQDQFLQDEVDLILQNSSL